MTFDKNITHPSLGFFFFFLIFFLFERRRQGYAGLRAGERSLHPMQRGLRQNLPLPLILLTLPTSTGLANPQVLLPGPGKTLPPFHQQNSDIWRKNSAIDFWVEFGLVNE